MIKKTMSKFAIFSLIITSLFITANESTYAADDDFASLLNMISSDWGTTDSTTADTTQSDSTSTDATWGNNWEVNLDSLANQDNTQNNVDTTPTTQTYSDEVKIPATTSNDDTADNTQYEPAPFVPEINNADTVSNDNTNGNFAPSNNGIPKLTVTGIADSIYVLIFWIIGLGIFIRRKFNK